MKLSAIKGALQAYVCFGPKADIGSFMLPVLCKCFCATDYLNSYVASPLIVDEFGLRSESLNIGRCIVAEPFFAPTNQRLVLGIKPYLLCTNLGV
jgi:hypothetical protein